MAAQEIYGREGSFVLRPEQLRIGSGGGRSASGVVTSTVYLGHATHIHVQLADGTHLVVLAPPSAADPAPGTDVDVSWDDADVVWLP